MTAEICQIPADPYSFVKLLTGLGISGLLAAVIWLLAKGIIRFGREDAERKASHVAELAHRDKQIEQRDAHITALTVDRNRWIDTALKHMEIVQKQGEALTNLKESVERLAETVEKMADEARKGSGKG